MKRLHQSASRSSPCRSAAASARGRDEAGEKRTRVGEPHAGAQPLRAGLAVDRPPAPARAGPDATSAKGTGADAFAASAAGESADAAGGPPAQPLAA